MGVVNILVLLAVISLPVQGAWWHQTNRLNYASENLGPEGIAFDEINEKFLVGSFSFGGVHHVEEDGGATVFCAPVDGFVTFGVKVSEDYIISANFQVPFNQNIGVAFYDREGSFLQFIDLSDLIDQEDGKVLNDVVFDKKGNVYATDSFGQAIYMIDTQDKDDNFVASVLTNNDMFARPEGGFGLNGIAYAKSLKGMGESLIVNWFGSGQDSQLFVIPIKKPEEAVKLDISGDLRDQFLLADGLLYDDDAKTIIVSSAQQVFYFTSEDNFNTGAELAYVTTLAPENVCGAATCVMVDGEVYVTCWGPFFSSGPYSILRASREVEALSAASAMSASLSVMFLAFVALIAQ